ncbi:hypothetical protein ACFVGY_17270 [Streptomyces sp. NPDC127106]|uniref:hypothetical protein n=1 Tax=Streptomyces sp. NPDC127106 TaxID=3345360 RepID=UPI003638F43E
MRDDVPAALDRGGCPEAVTPWDEEPWRAAVFAWVERELAARGMRATGRRAVRLRPWSVLVRLTVEETAAPAGTAAPTAGSPATTLWFKAGPPAGAFEAGLAEALARWAPGHVLAPLAVAADAIGRAASWGRVFPAAAATAGANGTNGANGHTDSARWLLELLSEPAL